MPWKIGSSGFSFFSMCTGTFTTQENATTKWLQNANYDDIRAKWNKIDLAIEFSDKDINECYEIFLKFHETIIEECVPKIIDKTEDERKSMKQKQKWLNWKVISALWKSDDI